MRLLAQLGLVVGLVLALGAPGAPVSAQSDGTERQLPVSWGVRPGRQAAEPDRAYFDVEADPGATVSDTLEVENHGEVDLVLGVYASDAFNTVDGELDLLPADEEPVDLGAWVSFAEPSITVPAGATVEVPFTVRVPSDAAAGDHVGGVLTSLTVTEPDAQGNRVRIERRLGTRLYLRVTGELEPALSFTALEVDHHASWNPFAAGSMTVRYRVENTGNVRLRSTRAVRVEGRFGVTEREVEGADLPELLPGGSLDLEQEVSGVWPALDTRVEVELQPYDPSGARPETSPAPIVGRTERTLVPYPQLALLVVLTGAAVTLAANRRRRERRIAEAVDRAVAAAVGRDAPPKSGATTGPTPPAATSSTSRAPLPTPPIPTPPPFPREEPRT